MWIGSGEPGQPVFIHRARIVNIVVQLNVNTSCGTHSAHIESLSVAKLFEHPSQLRHDVLIAVHVEKLTLTEVQRGVFLRRLGEADIEDLLLVGSEGGTVQGGGWDQETPLRERIESLAQPGQNVEGRDQAVSRVQVGVWSAMVRGLSRGQGVDWRKVEEHQRSVWGEGMKMGPDTRLLTGSGHEDMGSRRMLPPQMVDAAVLTVQG
jgi:hypothetical protein